METHCRTLQALGLCRALKPPLNGTIYRMSAALPYFWRYTCLKTKILILRAHSRQKYQYVNITRNIPTCPWFMHSNTKTGEVSNVKDLNFY